MREIQTDTEALWKERHELLDDVRTMASGLVDLANAAASRVQPREAAEPEQETLQAADEDEAEPPGVAPDQPTWARPGVGLDEGQGESPDETAESTIVGPGGGA
jgi:hypothetical protein